MPSSEKIEKSPFKELVSTFLGGLQRFFNDLQHFTNTSSAVLKFQPIYEDQMKESRNYIRDTKYAYHVFQYILLFIILVRFFSFESDIAETDELAQELAVLVFFFVEILIVLSIATLLHKFFFGSQDKRIIQATFIYAFSMPFLPCYLISYVGYDVYGDSDPYNGLIILLLIFDAIFFSTYFFKLTKLASRSTFKSVLLGILLSVGFSFLLVISVVVITGIAFGEAA
ncbi:MAG: hypothetical protein Tsb0034_10070 [Ekhidna sp.]